MKKGYRRFSFSKLVRDEIVNGISSSGNLPKYRKLLKDEFLVELKKKLLEEAQELPLKNKKEIIEELADVQEIIDNLMLVFNITKTELSSEQIRKNEKAGSFKKRLYIDYVDAKSDSEWVDYYLKSPEKYPEIKNKK